MKKVWFGMSAAALAGVMCVGLVGCGSGVDAKSIKGYEVEAEQWVAAFEALEAEDAEYTVEIASKMNMSMEMDLKDLSEDEKTLVGTMLGIDLSGKNKLSAGAKGSEEATYVKNGAKEYAKEVLDVKYTGDMEALMGMLGGLDVEEGKTTIESYAEYTEDGYVLYEKDEDDKWTKDEDGYSVIEDYQWSMYKHAYSTFTYSAKDKGYIPSDYDAEEDETYLVIKFDKDGQLAAIYSKSGYEQEQMGMQVKMENETHVVFTYKAKSITLPTVSEE